MTELIGFIGTLIILIAYIPQISNIVKHHTTAGLSLKAWFLWLIGTALVLVHAINIKEPVFITLTGISLVSIIIIVVLIEFYGKKK